MNSGTINLAGFGIQDSLLVANENSPLIIRRKGDIWNARTGKKYSENNIRLKKQFQDINDIEDTVNELLSDLNSLGLNMLFMECREVELQVWILLDDAEEILANLPAVNFSKEHIHTLNKLNASIDVSIS